MKVNMEQPNDLLLDDLEQLLREIDDFNAAIGNNKSVDIPQSLENYLHFVAKSGNTVFPWPHVRSLFRAKMVNAIQQFQEPASQNESFVLDRFDYFRLAAPFTVQRLTELILQPTRHYRKKEKFLRGLEKTVVVVSTVEPRSLINDGEKNGNEGNDITSCEEDTENNSFNRTFTLNRQEMLRASSIDIINQSLQLPLESPDGILLDTVTTSAVSDVIKQNLGIAGDVIIPDNVTDPNVAAMGLITPDIAIAVSSDSIIIDPVVSDASSASLVNIETEPDAVSAMECESSTVTDPSTIVQCVTEEDLLSQAAAERLTQAGSVLEGVSSTLVTIDGVELPIRIDSVETVECEPSIPVPTEGTEEQTKNLIPFVSGEGENDANLATSDDSKDTTASSSDADADTVMEVTPVEAEDLPGESIEKSEPEVVENAEKDDAPSAPCEPSVPTAPETSEQNENTLSTSATTEPCPTPETQKDTEVEEKASDITDESKSSETETPPAQLASSIVETGETIPVDHESESNKPGVESSNAEVANVDADASGETDSSAAAVENA